MKRIVQFAIAIIAIGAGLFGAWYGRTTYLNSVVSVQLPVPQSEIEPYSIITPDMLAWREYPRALISSQHDYASQPEQLVGKIATSTLLAGLPVPVQRVASPEEFRLAAEDLEVLSLPVSPEVTVGGQVKVGDKVNIYLATVLEGNNGEGIIPAVPADVFTGTLPAHPVMAPGTQITATATVHLVATVPVIQILSGDGLDVAGQGEDPQPLQILVVAAPPDIAQEIIRTQAVTTVGNNQVWITLATP